MGLNGLLFFPIFLISFLASVFVFLRVVIRLVSPLCQDAGKVVRSFDRMPARAIVRMIGFHEFHFLDHFVEI